MTSRGWARISVAAAAVVLALTAASTLVARPRACGGLADGYPPIIAFELARDGRDLAALFGAPGPCRDRLVTAMDTANVVDLAAFLPAYALFLIAWFVARRGDGARWARAGVVVVAVAAVADVIEDVCLLALTPRLDPASPWLARLPWITGVKWLALGAVGALAAARLVRGSGAARLGAALCLAAPAVTAAAMIDPHRFGPVVSAAVAASWIVCLIDAVRRAR